MSAAHFLVRFSQAEDMHGSWVAHCLDLDVVTWAGSKAEAIYMAREAILLTIAEDVEAGLDYRTRRAPDEAWEEFERAIERSTVSRTLQSIADDPDFDRVFYAYITIQLPDGSDIADQTTTRPTLGVAAA
ncbi:MAG: hypothetical protein AB1Z98_16060 [Nannocystaceae bacterium]